MGKSYFDNMPAVDISALKSSLGIADEGNANDYFYLKTEVDALIVGAKKPSLLTDIQVMGSNVKALPFGAYILQGGVISTATLTDGRLIGSLFVITEPLFLTGFGYSIYTAGDYTADNYNGISLYKVTGDVIDVVVGGQTADDGNMWKVAGNNEKALPTPITLTPGLYYVRSLYNSSAQTTAPLITSFGTCSALIPGTQLKGSIRATGVATPAAQYVISTSTVDTYVNGVWMY